ncbi:hypothetical protein [Sphingomonas sp. 1P08PE]|uniref:hypothetical protein n=1 Tax=Sphingomonas sp. 1P08PE TaxID=554122 RepID=UPI0039A1946C
MIALALSLAVQAAAPPATPPATAPAATAPAKLRCRRIETTGSFARSRRVCRTDAEWRAAQGRSDLDLDRMRDRTPVNSQRPVG